MPNDFVKELFNAKTKAEEEYRKGLVDWKPFIYQSQIDNVRIISGDTDGWARIEGWIHENWEVVNDRTPETINRIHESWARINEELREAYLQRLNMNYFAAQGRGKTWLGSQIEQQREWVQRGYRVEEMLAVPGIRGLGYSADKAYFDEACSWPTDDNRSVHGTENEESDPALGEWLQRRSICYRTSSCGLA